MCTSEKLLYADRYPKADQNEQIIKVFVQEKIPPLINNRHSCNIRI